MRAVHALASYTVHDNNEGPLVYLFIDLYLIVKISEIFRLRLPHQLIQLIIKLFDSSMASTINNMCILSLLQDGQMERDY
jgi:hypothetical protein